MLLVRKLSWAGTYLWESEQGWQKSCLLPFLWEGLWKCRWQKPCTIRVEKESKLSRRVAVGV